MQKILQPKTESKERNRYFLIYEDGSDIASYATVGLEDTIKAMKDRADDKVDIRFKEVSLQEWTNEQLSWEDEDPEHTAAIYEWAAKLAKEDWEAEQAKRRAEK